MRKWTGVLLVAVLMSSFGAYTWAQEKEQPDKDSAKQSAPAAKPASEPRQNSVFKLDFTVSELENGKRSNVRNYTLMGQEREYAEMSVSTRVPVSTGGTGGSSMVSTQFQYMDVGLSFRFRVTQEGEHVVLNGNFSMSSFAMPDQAKETNYLPPVVRRVSATIEGAVLPGKPTVIATLDDINSTKRYQMEVTATKVK